MWLVRAESGESFVAPFVVAASGILSVPLEPDIPGMGSFAGASLFTSRWPKEGFDLVGKRIGVIGTGSTGVQLIPVVARQALQLYVFQRSPAYTLPWRVHRFEPGELDEMKSRYGEIRAAQRAHPIGAARLSAFSVLLEMLSSPPIKSASREEQLRAIEEHGVMGALNWGDIFFDIEANRMAGRLYGEAVARIVKDPQTAASLVPVHPFACKRPIIDQGYYETFNRDNVTLVDLRKAPIRDATPRGIRTEAAEYDLDVLIYATGFDAMTGALSRIDIRGRDAMSLGEFWATEGPLSYLGLAVAGFPNLFTIQGPGSPSAATNFVAALEQHVEWIGDCIAYLRDNGIRTIEALGSAQQEWIDHATALVAPTVLVHPSCNSWYNGGNVPGKSGCIWAIPAGSPNIGAAATKSPPADTPVSSWHDRFGAGLRDVSFEQLDRVRDADCARVGLGQPSVVGPQLQQRFLDGGMRGEQARRRVDRHIHAEVFQLGQGEPRRLPAGDLVEQQRFIADDSADPADPVRAAHPVDQ